MLLDLLLDRVFHRNQVPDERFWKDLFSRKIERFKREGVSDWGVLTSRRYYELLFDDVRREAALPTFRGVRVLEAGCGTGVLSLMMAAHGADVTLVDRLDEALEYSAIVEGDLRRSGAFGGRVRYLSADFRDLSRDCVHSGGFDLVHNAGIVEEVRGKERIEIVRAMQELSRNLVLVGVPNPFNPYLLQLWSTYGKSSEQHVSRSSLTGLADEVGSWNGYRVFTTSCLHPRQGASPFWKRLGRMGLGFLHCLLGAVHPASSSLRYSR